MSLLAFSSTRLDSTEDLHPFERLLATLSSSFSTLDGDVHESVAIALEDIAAVCGVGECTLLSLGERSEERIIHSWAAQGYEPCRDEDLARMPWLIARLVRNSVVAIT